MPLVPRLLALALVAALAACSGGGDDAAPPSTTDASPTTVAASPQPAVAPPAVGTYRYRLDAGGADPEEVRTVVTDPGGEGLRREVDVDSGRGRVRSLLVWSPQAVVAERSTFLTDAGEFECVWQPAIVELPQPLAQGASWSVDSSCETTIDGGPGRIRREARREVTGTERVQVGEATVEVWVVTGTERTTVELGPRDAPSLTQAVESVLEIAFDPRLGLDVSTTTGSRTVGTTDPPLVRTRTLLSLEPS